MTRRESAFLPLVSRKFLRHASSYSLAASLASAAVAAPPSTTPSAGNKPVPAWSAVPPRTPASGTAPKPAASSNPPAARAAPAGKATPKRPGALAPRATKPGAPEATSPQLKKARDLWYRGVDAFRNGNYEAARLAFTECYQLMPKSDVLRNLSISEIHSGHYVSAARHLTQLLEAPGELPPNVREEATTRLAQAQAQIGQLGIEVDVAGADIRIDGEAIGRSPLEGNWYIEPGQHEVVISKAGYPVERRQVFALVGVLIPINVGLEELKREQARDTLAAELMGTQEGQDARADDRDSISTGSTIALVTLGTLAAVSLAGAIVYTVSANGHESNSEGLASNFWGDGACKSNLRGFEESCTEIKREVDAAKKDRTIAIGAFAGFGVASAATLGYALWLALDDNEIEPGAATSGISPSLSISPHGASVGVGARF